MDRGRTWHTTRRTARVDLDADAAWQVVASGEDRPQWYVDAAPFVFRRVVDRLVLGPGLRRPPPGRPRLAEGDQVGFWDVVAADHRQRRLILRAMVRSPGQVTLTASVVPAVDGSLLDLAITLSPRGVVGRAYLLADLPAREAVSELVMLHLLTVLRRRDNPWPTGSVDQV